MKRSPSSGSATSIRGSSWSRDRLEIGFGPAEPGQAARGLALDQSGQRARTKAEVSWIFGAFLHLGQKLVVDRKRGPHRAPSLRGTRSDIT
jgi:hypothetical protein